MTFLRVPIHYRLPFVGVLLVLIVTVVCWQALFAPVQWTPEKLAQTPQSYDVLWNQQRIGQQQQSLEQLPDGTWQWHQLYFLNAKARDATISEHIDELLVFDHKPPYRLRFGEIQRNNERFTVQNESAFLVQKDGVTVVESAALDFGLGDKLYALQSMSDAEQSGTVLQWRQFNATTFQVQTAHVKLIAQTIAEGKPVWQVAITEDPHQSPQEAWFGVDGVLQKMIIGAIELRRVNDAASAANPLTLVDVYEQQTIPTDRALGDVHNISSLALRWPQHMVLPLQKRSDQFVQAGFVRTEIGRNASATAEEQVIAMAPEPRYSSDNEKFIRQSKALTRSLRDTEQRVRALLLFVSEHLRPGTELTSLTAHEILQKARGDCTEYAQLFVALARANGVPAREISGLVYLGDKQQRFGGHTWAEVVINGRWQAVDPMWNLFGVTATHLRMGEGEQGALATLAHDARLQFNVEQIRYKQ